MSHLRLPFDNEYAHPVWSADLGVADTSVLAVLLYMIVARKVAYGTGNTSALGQGVSRPYQDGALSPWITEDEASDSFSPPHPDVFHAAYEEYRGVDATPRPAKPPTRGAGEVASREHALPLFPRYIRDLSTTRDTSRFSRPPC